MCVCSEEKYSDTAECPRSQPLHPRELADASGCPYSRHNSHGPSNNYVDRHHPSRSDTMPRGHGHPRSSDFHTQRYFRSAASGRHPPNEEHPSVVDAAAAACILPPYHCDGRHLVQSASVMPTGAGLDDWRRFEPTSSDVPFNSTVSFVRPPTQHSRSGRWANGQASGGHSWSGQPWGQDTEWTPVVNRRRYYQRSRGLQSHRSKRYISPNANRNYY